VAASTWLKGCGIGCGVILLLGLVVTGSCVVYCTRTFGDLRHVEASYEALEEAHGDTEAYTPPPDGAIPADRLEVFLSVRDALGDRRRQLEDMFDAFPPEGVDLEGDSFWKAMKVIRSLANMVKPVGQYVEERNDLLLESGMGTGEYLYIYSVAYHSWLGHDPADGPSVRTGRGGRRERLLDGEDGSFAPDRLRRICRRYATAWIANQIEALPGRGDGEEADPWHATLEAEARRLRRTRETTLWAEGLPEAVAASLEPSRERLANAYSAALNCFEIPPDGDARGSWSITFD
jgi:hypothetical protein